MHVVATAGHVDHGKSTLVRALTGSEPDRLAEERRRGLSIELGYCWTALPPVGDVAFVDVAGHERFVSTMLAGVGPVPAVLFVVAADDPWMPQAAEHPAALDALGLSHGVLAVTRSDVCDPAPSLARARAELAGTSLRDSPAVAVSGRTGAGLDELRRLVAAMVGVLSEPSPGADVRLWLDRCFHVRGAGTVVTGTLPAGRVSVGDLLALGPGTGGAGRREVRVRGVRSLGLPVESATGVARVALNISGTSVEDIDRGGVLVTPDAWQLADLVDVRVRPAPNEARLDTESGAARHRTGRGSTGRLPERPLLHIGAASVAAHCRPLGDGLVRLRLDQALPLRIGDRALLRDPGNRRVWGATVLDPAPEPLRRRGAARTRAAELGVHDGVPDLAAEVRRREVVRIGLLRRIGVDVSALHVAAPGPGEGPGESAERRTDVDPTDAVAGAGGGEAGVVSGDWVVSRRRAAALRGQLEDLVGEHERGSPLDRGVPVAAAANALGLPASGLVEALVRAPLRVVDGRVVAGETVVLPETVERALAGLETELGRQPFAAPTADRLRALGLDARTLAVAARAGRLLRVGDGIVLLPGAEEAAVDRLGELPQPFTTSEARVRLGTTRRVVLPLLAHLDRTGRTRRLPDDRRTVRPR